MSRFNQIIRRPVQLVAVVAALGVAGVAVAASSDQGKIVVGGEDQVLRITLSLGLLFGQTNDKGNGTVLTAQGLVPGESKWGEVRVANTGLLAGAYTLQATDLVDTLGRFGGKLSPKLNVKVDERSRTGVRRLYDGTLASLSSLNLGRFASGENRVYRFTATLPSGGIPSSPTSGDNAVQGAVSRVNLRFTASSTL
ncbi:hypothetical protein [Conexibacter sp. SYSU D00693]|uniref:hypothetical protein n=1 Tax=Conexibacter sp. SYSU D00693 TaxID=2812560 RepID=UPI00196ADE2F|nr:hypothetical protein [Conexibacter sp. SYSU D00693]